MGTNNEYGFSNSMKFKLDFTEIERRLVACKNGLLLISLVI